MRDELIAYFLGEKRGALILLAVGIAALGAAIALLVTKSTYRGMAIPLVLAALGELTIGVALVARTDGQVASLLDQLTREPAVMARAELARMEPVMRSFRIIKIVELAVFAGGVILAYVARKSDLAFAVGTGFVAQAGLLLVFDLIAERRGERYVEVLRALLA